VGQKNKISLVSAENKVVDRSIF